MKLAHYFRSFLDSTVNLNDTRIATLNSRVDALTSFLRDHDTFSDYFIDVIPQGSYAQRTIIKPVGNREYDADVLLAMKEHPDWSPADYTAQLKRAFEASGTYKGMAHKRTRCVFIDYADEFHVDVIPFVEDRPAITNNKVDDWETTDPQAFTEWLEGKSRIVGGGRLQAVLRLLKYLRDSKGTFSIKSVLLTILVGERIESWRTTLDAKYYADVPTALVHVIEDLSAFLQQHEKMPPILDPGGTGRDFRERWDEDGYANFRKQVSAYAEKMRNAYEAETLEESVAGWQAVFGASFTAPASKVQEKSASNERFIDTSLNIPVRLSNSISLVGRVRSVGVYRAYDLPKRGDRVQKQRTIDFEIRSCDVEGDFQTYWKVKNTGREAGVAGQLRGEISQGDGSWHETTSYVGSHYVEVYIVQHGVCVAIDRQSVIIQPRNNR